MYELKWLTRCRSPQLLTASPPMPLSKPHGLSAEYWRRLPPAHQELYAIVRPLTAASYEVDVHLARVPSFLDRLKSDVEAAGGSFELQPDFQRGHVWSPEQQVRFIESLLRGCAPARILFNCPGWLGAASAQSGDIAPQTLQCIDGLQRLTAAVKFVKGDLAVFDGRTASDFEGTPFDLNRLRLQVAVFEFSRRADLLQFYLDLNAGGTVHSRQELERVAALRTAATRPGA